MAFRSDLTSTSQVDHSLVSLYSSAFFLASQPNRVAESCVSMTQSIPGAKIVYFTKYASLSTSTSALTETNDVTAQQMSDSQITFTIAEHGEAIALTEFAEAVSGGKVDLAAAQLLGNNAGDTMDKLAIAALDASGSTVIYPNAVSAVTGLSTADVLDKTFANRLYNKLSRTNTPKMGGFYIGLIHPDCAFDLIDSVGTGSWVDVSKYANPASVLQNEIGTFAGIRWIQDGNATISSDANGTIDAYTINVVGFNALGKAEHGPLQAVMTPATDPLQRFPYLGWKWRGVYDTIDSSNQIIGKCASSVGSNS